MDTVVRMLSLEIASITIGIPSLPRDNPPILQKRGRKTVTGEECSLFIDY
jgi:hypothetical protein